MEQLSFISHVEETEGSGLMVAPKSLKLKAAFTVFRNPLP